MQNVSKITYGIVAVLVAVLLICVTVFPVIEDSKEVVDPTTDLSNVDMYSQNMTSVKKGTAYALSFADSTFTINGETVSSTASLGAVWDTGMIYFGGNGVPGFYYMDSSTGDYERYLNIATFNVSIDPSAKTISGTAKDTGDVTYTINSKYSEFSAVRSASASDMLYVDSTFARSYYFNDNQPIYSIQYSGTDYIFWFDNDKVLVNGEEEGTVTMNKTIVTGSDDTYTMLVKNTSGSDYYMEYDNTIYYPHFVLVSSTVTSSDEGGNSIYGVLLGILPMLLLVVPIMLVVKMIASKRD